MRTETCATCRFFVADRLECHRYPPGPVNVGHSVWATARPGDFCGEHRPWPPADPNPNPLPSVEILTPGRGS